MALNFTVSYTFSPSTTISSSQVNTNTSDVANVFTGLEALTKTLAKLKVDVDPTTALEVATKQYVDHYSTLRRPVLQYSSATVVVAEAGIDGTTGEMRIAFPDGSVRTDSTNSRIQCTMTQTAAFSGSAQSGIDTGSVSANTWYCFYAVKVTDSSTNMVVTASLLPPNLANYPTLNTRFQTSGWVYLGTLPYGDNSGTTTSIPPFSMVGNRISFSNVPSGAVQSAPGVALAHTAGATSLTWTWAAGTALASGQIPAHIGIGDLSITTGASALIQALDSASAINYLTCTFTSGANSVFIPNLVLSKGLKNATTGSVAQDILLRSYTDGILGIGANPLL